ncbi:MAG TPA: NAD(P)/FAD-dependent oxidoreductase [Solirubrobacteraceae bacterium]|nr:NAD(P)/FAD-dependent oxidoreductase [Solirubrobacteraceae bacterium]
MRVAVLGAGVCGLVAAHRLARAGHAVEVYERWPGLGGQAATLDVGDGHRLERYYHHLFTSDRHIAELFAELGMPDAIEWRPSSVAFFARGELHPFVTPLDLLRFRALSPLARVRMGAAVLALQRFAGDPAPYARVTARDWIERRMGRQAWEEVWGPLLRGKFGERADRIAMVWLWSKLRLRRSVKGEGVRQERLGYPRESWEPLFGALARSVVDGGGRVLTDRPAARVARAGSGFTVQAGPPGSFRRGHDPREFDAGPGEQYDRVLATVPNDVFERLLDPALASEVGEEYLRRTRAIEYFAALCLLLELDRRFSPYYWTNVADRALPFVGLIEHTNFVEPERYGGRRFLYVANYLPHGHELLGLDAGALLGRYEAGLRAVNPAFSTDWVLRSWLHVEPAAQPIVTVGYGERIPPLRTPAAGLVLANTTQVYPEDRGTNYAVRLGEAAAAAVPVCLDAHGRNAE